MIQTLQSRARMLIDKQFDDMYISDVHENKSTLDYLLNMSDAKWNEHYKDIEEHNNRLSLEAIQYMHRQVAAYKTQVEELEDWHPSNTLEEFKSIMKYDILDAITKLNIEIDKAKTEKPKVFDVEFEKNKQILEATNSYELSKIALEEYRVRRAEKDSLLNEIKVLSDVWFD